MMNKQTPVTEGEEREVKIDATGSKGDGIAKIDGYTVFVPDTNFGDRVKIRIKRVLPQYAFSEVIEVIEKGGKE